MPTPTTCDTLLVDGVDIQDYAYIENAEGLLGNGPLRADIITTDWVAGAIVQQGPRDTWSFDVPVVMKSYQRDIAYSQLRTLQAMQGGVKTLTRRLTVNGAVVEETCTAVMINAPQVVWNFDRILIHAVLVWQVTSPWQAA